MVKIIKKVTLNAPASTSTPSTSSGQTGVDPTKGTITNPFTQVEMATLQEECTWNGGFVAGMGYIVPTMMAMYDSYSSNYPTYPPQDGFLTILSDDNTYYFFSNDNSYLILPGVEYGYGPIDDMAGDYGDLEIIHNFAELMDFYECFMAYEFLDENGYIITDYHSWYGEWVDQIVHELDNSSNFEQLFPDVCHRLGLGYAERYTRHDAIIRP